MCVFVADITGSALVQGGGPAADLRADRLTRSGLRRMIGLDHGTVSEAEERDHAAETAADHVPETERGRGHTRSYTAPSFLVFSLVMYYNISVLPLSRRSRSRDRRRSRSRDRRRSKSRSRGRRSTSDTTTQHIQNHQLFLLQCLILFIHCLMSNVIAARRSLRMESSQQKRKKSRRKKKRRRLKM